MTARQEARVGAREQAAGQWSYETQRAPKVGELLQTARERKGVDLVRAERETKIRARHLAALESGDLADLPAPVYAKGFLRNYSTYLGLDAEEMLARWRRETDQPAKRSCLVSSRRRSPSRRPAAAFKLTGGLFVALVLAAIVFVFVGYVGLQLVRFTQNPEIALNGPSIRQLAPGAERLVLSGTGTPNALVTATGADDLRAHDDGQRPGRVDARSAGQQGPQRLHHHRARTPRRRASPSLSRSSPRCPSLDVIGSGAEAPALPDGVDTSQPVGRPVGRARPDVAARAPREPATAG